MFREMRRQKKALSIEDTKELLKSSRRGVLAVNGDDGYPYAVPVNYLYCEDENKIIFHGSRIGHKNESIRKDSKVCFTVYGNEMIKDIEWAPYVQSVVVFGKCTLVEDFNKGIELVTKLATKYYPSMEEINEEVEKDGKGVQMFVIDIEHMTGKQIQEI